MYAKGSKGGSPLGHAGVAMSAVAKAWGPCRVHVASRWSNSASVGTRGQRRSAASWEREARAPAARDQRI
eukprot:10831327-Alexandrium_andersonii.AAC.1